MGLSLYVTCILYLLSAADDVEASPLSDVLGEEIMYVTTTLLPFRDIEMSTSCGDCCGDSLSVSASRSNTTSTLPLLSDVLLPWISRGSTVKVEASPKAADSKPTP